MTRLAVRVDNCVELNCELTGRPSSTYCTVSGSGQTKLAPRNALNYLRKISMRFIFAFILSATSFVKQSTSSQPVGFHNGFQLYSTPFDQINPPLSVNQSSAVSSTSQQIGTTATTESAINNNNNNNINNSSAPICSNGLLTFELSTGFIYKPSSAETLAMMPSTLQLTDCLDYCLQNASCLAINFEMGLCVLLSSSAKQNPTNLYSSQFPVFTIYAEKKCLLAGDPLAPKQRRRCQRAWTFERVAGYEMKTRPRKRLKFANKEHCMEACLIERDFECRSANWYRQTGECTLSDQDRHSVSQSEAGDQQLKLQDLYGPSNLTLSGSSGGLMRPTMANSMQDSLPGSLYQNYYMAGPQERSHNLTNNSSGASIWLASSERSAGEGGQPARPASNRYRQIRQLEEEIHRLKVMPMPMEINSPIAASLLRHENQLEPPLLGGQLANSDWPSLQYVDMPANALVDYLENNCIYEPNKLCEFRKIQNRVLKTVDSIYQDVLTLDECKQKCLNAPYRCYSFDYGDTSERVCRTSHLDQASLLSVKEPYLDVVGAITYELASCFNVSIQCKAREMVALVSSSKTFKGKIYVKSRPNSCVNDVRESLQFELTMRYHDENCDVRASSNSKQGVFSNDIVIQHHDRIVTTQDVGLSVYCQYDLGNKSITNNVDLAIERLPDESIESKTQPTGSAGKPGSGSESGSVHSPLTITSLATTVVRSPNVTMRITNMNGQPVTSATVGDRLALLFEIKEKSSPFGIFVREIIAMDGLQLLKQQQQQQQALNNATRVANNGASSGGRLTGKGGLYHYAASAGPNLTTTNSNLISENSLDSFEVNKANSIQFIDSQGCPTDSNIMGPLVRMDPAGHRILAPFDAFKFPTSDMVFFRAVVSSCISDCKPVLCPPNGPSPVTFNPQLAASLAGSQENPPASSVSHHLASTSRNMPPTRLPTAAYAQPISHDGATQIRHSTAATPFDSTETVSRKMTTGASSPPNTNGFEYVTTLATQLSSSITPSTQHLTVAPPLPASTGERRNEASSTSNPLADLFDLAHIKTKPLATPANGSASANATATLQPPIAEQPLDRQKQPTLGVGSSLTADSLTTVPGFGAPDSWSTGTLDNQIMSSSVDSSAQSQAPMTAVNMTNNHFGKAPPRPTLANNHMVNEKPQAPIVDLDSLSTQQKRQLIQMFESKFEQVNKQQAMLAGMPNNSRLHMTDMGDFLAVTLNEFTGANQNNSLENASDEQQTAKSDLKIESKFAILLSIINALELLNRDSHLVSELQKLPKPLMALQLDSNVANQSVPMDGADNQLIESGSNASNELEMGGNHLNAALRYTTTTTTTNGQQVVPIAQQTFDRPDSNTINKPERIRSQQQQMAGSGSKTSANKLATMTKVIKQEEQQRQQVRRTTRDKSQAFADSYLGALQSSGGRPRRRRKRRRRREARLFDMGAAKTLLNEDRPRLTPGYVYLEQPQQLTVAPSEVDHNYLTGDHHSIRFTRAIVEMYHTTATTDGAQQLSRFKREAQPFYDVDELIVQSIKIMDRVQADESQPRHKPREGSSFPAGKFPSAISRSQQSNFTSASNRQSLSRSSLVTHPAAHWSRPDHQNRNSSIGKQRSIESALEEESTSSQQQTTSWTGSGALSLFVVALCLIFMQLFLVLVCLLDWGSKRKSPPITMIHKLDAKGAQRQARQQLLVDHGHAYTYGYPASSPSSICSATSRKSNKTMSSLDISDEMSAYSVNYHHRARKTDHHRAHLQRLQQQQSANQPQFLKPMFLASSRPHPVSEGLHSPYVSDESMKDKEWALNKHRCIACLLPNSAAATTTTISNNNNNNINNINSNNYNYNSDN